MARLRSKSTFRGLVPALLCTVVVVAMFWLPREDAVRQAAASCGELLRLVPAGPADAPQTQQSLGEQILASSAVERTADGQATLALFGVQFAAVDPPSSDLIVHDIARRSLVVGLRQMAAEHGIALVIDGEQTGTQRGRARGVNCLVQLDKRTLALGFSLPDGTRGGVKREDFQVAPRWSIAPMLLAIALALWWRRPVIALFLGACCAAFLARRAEQGGVGFSMLAAVPDVFTRGIGPQLQVPGRVEFLLAIAASIGMVAVISRNGGARGLVDALGRVVRGRRATLFLAWLIGLVTFADDSASRLFAGATVRPLSDRFRISREKLAYVIDSTAVAVAGLALLTTWSTHEVAALAPMLPSAKVPAQQIGAVLIEMLPLRFYCIFTLFTALVLALTGRDFGSMLGAERRARRRGLLVGEGAQPMLSEPATSLESDAVARAHRALVPLACFALAAGAEIARQHMVRIPAADLGIASLLQISDPARALLLGSSAGLVAAIALAFAAGVRGQVFGALWLTVKAGVFTASLLLLSWSIAAACGELGTARYVLGLLGDSVAPQELPCLLFLLAAAVAFATGTARGALAVLLPMVVALAYQFGERSTLGGHGMALLAIAALLEGALFGRHLCPWSPSTILASTAAASDAIDHARTQSIYALVVAGVTLCLGYFPCGFLGWHWGVALAAGCTALLMLVLVFGRHSEPEFG